MKARRFWPILLISWLFARSTGGMVHGEMSDAEWFAESNKILILEYENPLGGKEGAQLSQLLGSFALATGTGIKQYAVVSLQQTKDHKDLTDANVKALAEAQHAPVVIWGEFYQQGSRIFVTSHLRYAPELAPESPLPVPGRTVGKFSWNISELNIPDRTEAYASFPSTQVNFSPIEISSANLIALHGVWQKTLTIRAEPSEGSAVQGELSLARPYSIRETINGWTRVSIDNRSGWVRLAALSRLSDFKEMAGVVLYAQGLMLHLTGNATAAAQTFSSYLSKYGAKQDPMNKAIADLVVGYSLLKSVGGPESSIAHFRSARELLPNASAPVNCLALALFAKAAQSSPSENEILALEKDLIHAVQTESDVDAIGNLEILYRLRQAEPVFTKKSPNFMNAREKQLKLLHNLELRVQRDPGG
jgi:SH3 domain-containing protein